jgi:hypothetical protein
LQNSSSLKIQPSAMLNKNWEMDMSQYSTAEILIAALLIWGLAISAAMWARFKHVGQPLTQPVSLLVAGGIWLAIFMILASGDKHASDTTTAGIFLVTLACYLILRMGNSPSTAQDPETTKQPIKQATTGGFENGLLLSISLGVFIFASQFSGLDSNSSDRLASTSTTNSQLSDEEIEDVLNAAASRKAALDQAEQHNNTSQQPTANASEQKSIRLEDGWNISLFHYDQSSDRVQIEAVTTQPEDSMTTRGDNALKSSPNTWHQIPNVKVVSYPEVTPATWIEVELSEADINTLRFAAETGAISIYSE